MNHESFDMKTDELRKEIATFRRELEAQLTVTEMI